MLLLETGEAGHRDAERVGTVSSVRCQWVRTETLAQLSLYDSGVCASLEGAGEEGGQKRACKNGSSLALPGQHSGSSWCQTFSEMVAHGFAVEHGLGVIGLVDGCVPGASWSPEMSPTGAGGCWLCSAGSFAQVAVLAAVGGVPRSQSKQEGGIHFQERV